MGYKCSGKLFTYHKSLTYYIEYDGLRLVKSCEDSTGYKIYLEKRMCDINSALMSLYHFKQKFSDNFVVKDFRVDGQTKGQEKLIQKIRNICVTTV